MRVQWNPTALTDHYIVSLSPLIDDNESESTFITSNTTIHLPLQHNQDYNISVMASNCAGNSTPAKISMRVGMVVVSVGSTMILFWWSNLGYCTLSTSEFGEINFKDNSTSGYVEGSKISFLCRDNGSAYVVATCMKNGSWSPDPHTYKCQKEDVASVTSNNTQCWL